ncbi:futalosine hydrolase [Desulfonatronospira sp.]|uniref:futalosine hydrolase n=1 Tax=Desulfonatronospira sp. TaxID=1962951 RepID=UPI0025C244A3|nr:futalosine hydrolase [Desulfonatronospira sp.]
MILLTAATSRELKHFCSTLSGYDFQDGTGCCSWAGGERVHLLACGVGPLNAALGLQGFLVTNPGIDLVINLGIAGSYDLKLMPVGAVCVATAEIWPEYGVRTGATAADPQLLGFPLSKLGTEAVWNRIELDPGAIFKYDGIFCESLPPNWVKAVSLTVAGVSGTPELARDLARTYNAGMENMEGFSLAYVCRMQGIPFFEVRSISNPAGSRDSRDWNFKAAFRSLAKVPSQLLKRG